MRSIKFRCWNITEKRYMKNNEYWLSPDGKVYEDDGYHAPTEPIISNNEYLLEQFTGLHDKNGVEIYEGDYIITKRKEKPFLIKWKSYLENCGDCFNDSGPGFNFELRDVTDDIEIVGNLHE